MPTVLIVPLLGYSMYMLHAVTLSFPVHYLK
jgi:hypothetical protein